ncbi:MAG: metallophosphoesterase [Bryobacteraceae bacterium]
MRYLILSDIHSNWEALEAVLGHAEGLYDQILSTGDLVGYGADPNPVVEWSRSNLSVVVRGNHDKVCAGLADMEWFGPRAVAAAAWTREQLSPANLEYLRNLPRGPLRVEDFQLMHGSPADEDEYIIESSDLLHIKPHLLCPVSFFGHTHLQGGFLAAGAGFETIPPPPPGAEERVVELPPRCQCLANPGSVGQPRDRDPRAAYLIYASKERVLRYRRVRYDVEAVQRKMRQAGLPAALADRLSAGR